MVTVVMFVTTVMVVVATALVAVTVAMAVCVRALALGFLFLASAEACEELGAVALPEVPGVHVKVRSEDSQHSPEHQLVPFAHHSGLAASAAIPVGAGDGDNHRDSKYQETHIWKLIWVWCSAWSSMESRANGRIRDGQYPC